MSEFCASKESSVCPVDIPLLMSTGCFVVYLPLEHIFAEMLARTSTLRHMGKHNLYFSLCSNRESETEADDVICTVL